MCVRACLRTLSLSRVCVCVCARACVCACVQLLSELDGVLSCLASTQHIRAAAAAALLDIVKRRYDGFGPNGRGKEEKWTTDHTEETDRDRILRAAVILLSDPVEALRTRGCEILQVISIPTPGAAGRGGHVHALVGPGEEACAQQGGLDSIRAGSDFRDASSGGAAASPGRDAGDVTHTRSQADQDARVAVIGKLLDTLVDADKALGARLREAAAVALQRMAAAIRCDEHYTHSVSDGVLEVRSRVRISMENRENVY